jgi:hypothetical protein
MADLRYRTFRLKVYGEFCPPGLPQKEREALGALIDALDEDGVEAFFGKLSSDRPRARVLEILKEARTLGERLNLMDRTLPALPHTEISTTYERLRTLGAEIDELQAQEASRLAG